MDGAVAAGELGRVAPCGRGSQASRLNGGARACFELATAGDDAGIRRLLRENPMAGDVQLGFEREPNAFVADAVEGDFHQTLVARDRGGAIVAIGGRSVRDAFVNGRDTRLGYLGQLRMAPGHRGRGVLIGGYAFLRELHGDGLAPFYLTSVMADNWPARRLLEAGLRGMPTYRPVGEWVTYALPTGRRRETRDAAVAAADGDVRGIADCLQRNGPRLQFSHVWNEDDIRGSPRTPSLSQSDFVVVRTGDRIAGCAAVWDQRSFKQVIVHGYAGTLGRWRRAINLLSPLTGWPALPPAGRPLNQAYMSHLAVDGDDPAAFGALLNAALGRAKEKGCDYLLAGYAAGHPLTSVLQRHKHRAVRSILYAVYWADGRAAVDALDGRLPHVEVATL